MNGNLVVLILGVLVLAYAVYFTHTILRGREAKSGADRSAVAFQVGSNGRAQVADAVRAAGEQRGLSAASLAADADRAREVFTGAPKFNESRCLWVDHDPDAIVHERRMLELLHVDIDIARTTNQALQFLVGRRYDFIVTDLTRPIASGGVDERAGIKLLKVLAAAPSVPPAIVYAEYVDLGDDSAEPAVIHDDDASDDDASDDDVTDDDLTDDDASDDDGGAADLEVAARPAPVVDERLDDARAAGARAAVTTPGTLLRSVLDIVVAG